MDELVNEGVFSSRGPLDLSSVETRSVEVMSSCSDLRARWARLEGSEAMQAVSAWFRAQKPQRLREASDAGHSSEYRLFLDSRICEGIRRAV